MGTKQDSLRKERKIKQQRRRKRVVKAQNVRRLKARKAMRVALMRRRS